ncbi:MAG TPA: toll/interleukin-1 receptor domain-containing protein [Thermoanaerobaculia bacterium]|nr:toll/interleukin-1 receptor domain-containing protein [Thermoanaerobaculia bacterium]
MDRLQEDLEKSGYSVQRDRDAQRPGDLISQFMKRLKAADRVVTVISGKYLRSVPCMDEIYRVYQRCQEDANLFAERVVPIILPEVQIRRPQQRAPIVRDWSTRADELDLLLKELGTKAGWATFEETRLARALSQHVDNILGFVVDILIPRNLKVPLESDFEGVKAALLRRLKT